MSSFFPVESELSILFVLRTKSDANNTIHDSTCRGSVGPPEPVRQIQDDEGGYRHPCDEAVEVV